MKKFKILVAITVLATTLVGCPDDILPAFDITEDLTHEVPVEVTATANGDCIDYSESFTFDMRLNSQINDNFDLIDNISINSITWEVTNYNGDDGVYINSGLLKVGGTTFEVGKVDLKAADDGNEMFVLTDAAKLTAISNEFKSNGSMMVILEVSSGGNCDNDHSYILKFTIDVKVRVQP